ncbi:type I pantothenate kinase [uncultured Agrococcus sp.]|uniref:type I pantothenate kinase n=1 Tax=uncultured Agrococcus sp. TaxID=382258 RepID=UPI0025CF8E24|nr:type I pantothenate kinase [uncultured Agrococcus sp.]
MTQHQNSPFFEIPRAEWSHLAPNMPLPLTEREVEGLRGLGEALELREVADVYLPLSRLISLYHEAFKRLHGDTMQFLGEELGPKVPFVIGVAGSVAVGKSTTARLLKSLLSRWSSSPRVDLVTTDGFLHPNAELERRGITARKGFPESYDRRALLNFVSRVKSGQEQVSAPVYSHLTYDIVPDEKVTVEHPDILIVEGLNVLQAPSTNAQLAVSDLFDFSVYVDAKTSSITNWYVERFLKLQRGAFTDPDSYFHRFANLDEEAAREVALTIWKATNLPNLKENILPTRSRADLVLRKAADHTVHSVLLRKL